MNKDTEFIKPEESVPPNNDSRFVDKNCKEALTDATCIVSSFGCGCLGILMGIAISIITIGIGIFLVKFAWKFLSYCWGS